MSRARCRQCRAARTDEAALSNVLGAIMIFGLLVITLVTIQVRFVPVWDEERESRHVDTVIDQLSLFKADVERLSTNSTGGTLTDPLTINPEGGFKFFQSASVGGAAEFVPSADGEGFALESPQLRVTRRDGQGLYALGEVWDLLTTGERTDITDINHLRVRVVQPTSQNNGDSATLEIRDADDEYAGKVVITAIRDPPDDLIQIEVFNATDDTNPFTMQSHANHQSTAQDYQYFNLLDDELLFDQVLAAAETPFDLALTGGTLETEYTIAYTTSTGGSSGIDGGLVVPDFSTSLSSGALVFETNNQRLPSQTFVFEHGALLVVQPDGAAMLVPPTLDVVGTEDQVVVDWVVPGLSGAATGISGVRAASMLAGAEGFRTQIEALAWELSFTVPTAYPAVWSAFLEERMELSGLTDDGLLPQFQIASTSSNVTLTVFGPVSDPTDHDEDVFLRYQQAAIAIELRPTG